MSRPYYVSQTTVLTVFCASVLLGLALARRVYFQPWWVAGCIVIPFVRKSTVGLIAIVLCGILLGVWRGSIFMNRLTDYQKLFKQPVILRAQADNDAIYGKQSQLSFDVVNVVVIKPKQQTLAGKVKVEGIGAAMVYRGDRLLITGRMSPTKGSAQAKVSFAKLQVVNRGHSLIDTFRRRFIAGLQSSLPEPEASFGAGLLIGQRSTIPKDINDQLSITGLTHLVAVSGYNLTIIIMAVRQIFGRRSKFQSTTAALCLVLLFIVITGLSASIIRAALVSCMSLLAWYYGRQFKPLLLIVLAAALTAFWNPFYLWSDIGWYLSFLAFFGVLLVAPLLVVLLARGKKPKTISALLAETIAAQAMTLPIIMYIFGRISVVGLVANILVVPLVPLAMLLTLLAGMSGMIAVAIAGWPAWPARILLTYMIDLTGILSRLPHAAAQHTIALSTMLWAYLALVCCLVLARWLRTRQNSSKMIE